MQGLHLQSFQASKASEHSSLQSCELVASEEKLQNAWRSVESSLADVPQLVDAQVAETKKVSMKKSALKMTLRCVNCWQHALLWENKKKTFSS